MLYGLPPLAENYGRTLNISPLARQLSMSAAERSERENVCVAGWIPLAGRAQHAFKLWVPARLPVKLTEQPGRADKRRGE